MEANRILKERDTESRKLECTLKTFCNSVVDKHQPTQKLHDAIVHAVRKAAAAATVEVLIVNLTVFDVVPAFARDCRVTMIG